MENFKVKKCWVSPDYIEKVKTPCWQEFNVDSQEYYINENKREVSVDISIKFFTKKDNILVFDGIFNKYYFVVISDISNEAVSKADENVFTHDMHATFFEIEKYLQSHLRVNIFELQPPLIDGIEQANTAKGIFLKLKKLLF